MEVKVEQGNHNDIEILDVEDYRGEKNMEFSHQSLVMKAMKRVLELGGHELADGINETSFDRQNNTTKVIYKEDTKKAFVNAIKMCVAVMSRDCDKEAEDNIEAIFVDIDIKKEELKTAQWNWWLSLNPKERSNSKLTVLKKFLHKDLPFDKEFRTYEIDCYFTIFEELNKLTSRIQDYQVADFEN